MTIARPLVIKALAAAAVAAVGTLAIALAVTLWQKRGLEADLAAAQATIAELRLGVERQNLAVQELSRQGRAAADRFDRALAAATKVSDRANATIARLLSVQGESCDDAAALLRDYKAGLVR